MHYYIRLLLTKMSSNVIPDEYTDSEESGASNDSYLYIAIKFIVTGAYSSRKSFPENPCFLRIRSSSVGSIRLSRLRRVIKSQIDLAEMFGIREYAFCVDHHGVIAACTRMGESDRFMETIRQDDGVDGSLSKPYKLFLAI